MLDRTNGAPFVRAGNMQRGDARRVRREKVKEFDVRAPGHRRPGRHALRAATSRRSCWRASSAATCRSSSPPSRRAASTSARSSSSTSASSRRATPASRSSSSPPSSTRSSPLADRIMVMYRGRIVGIVPGDTPRDVLGLMMAGEAPSDGGGRRVSEQLTGGASITDRRARRAAPPAAVQVARTRSCEITAGQRASSRCSPSCSRCIVGGIMIAFTDEEVQAAAGYFFARPSDTLVAIWDAVVGRLRRRSSRARSTTSGAPTFARGIRPLTETLTFATPLIAGGPRRRARLPHRHVQHRWPRPDAHRGVRVAGWVGVRASICRGAPHARRPRRRHHRPVRCGPASRASLKARTGAHEVIVTIMLNYVAFYLVSGCCARRACCRRRARATRRRRR